ncbi:MAG TPA: class I SAM-dependent methyltransferase [Candidatus Paceibacterota bacterium]
MTKSNNKTQTTAWNSYYKQGPVPWQSVGLSKIVKKYLATYAVGKSLLEIGCGNGKDAQAFLKAGLRYTGVDVSKEAVKSAQQYNPKYTKAFLSGDFLTWRTPKKFSVVYDKGVFHNLAGPNRRSDFARRVASILAHGGIWITICGSADNFDPRIPHGAIFLQHVIEPVEFYFEVLEVIKAPYGSRGGNFDAWYCVFRRR